MMQQFKTGLSNSRVKRICKQGEEGLVTFDTVDGNEVTTDIPFTHTMSGVRYPKGDKECAQVHIDVKRKEKRNATLQTSLGNPQLFIWEYQTHPPEGLELQNGPSR
ncbi:hypothetical protein TNCV_4100821 [Trichonephila clavipes]|nr:hypothetical protein TNCV_4100821 [Trichonephila clavipes]